MMLRDFDTPSAVMRLIVMALVPEQISFWVVIKRWGYLYEQRTPIYI